MQKKGEIGFVLENHSNRKLVLTIIIVALVIAAIILGLLFYNYFNQPVLQNEQNNSYSNETVPIDQPGTGSTLSPKTSFCGDGKCNGTENYTNCAKDCKKPGGGGGGGGNPGTPAPACTPKTCANYLGQCGIFDDGCGGTIKCGCPEGLVCNFSGECESSETACLHLRESNKANNLTKNELCVIIEAENITLDCNGYTISNDGTTEGIYSNYNYTTIKNCEIINTGSGVYLTSSNNYLDSIDIISNHNYGIYLASSYNRLRNIYANDNFGGIVFFYSSNNTIDNVSSNNNAQSGITFMHSNNNKINNISSNNNMDHGVYILTSDKNILNQISVNNNKKEGILLYFNSKDNKLSEISSNNNENHGIYIFSSGYNRVSNSTIKNNKRIGINLLDSDYNIIFNINSAENNELDLFLNKCFNLIQNVTGSGDLPIGYYPIPSNIENEEFSELILCGADYSNLTNITIRGSETKNNNGFLIFKTMNSTINNITSNNNNYGIYLVDSKNNITDSSFCSNRINVNCSSDQVEFSDNTCEGGCGTISCEHQCQVSKICEDDYGCYLEGNFCDKYTPYTCTLEGDCLKRTNKTECNSSVQTCNLGSCVNNSGCLSPPGCRNILDSFCEGNQPFDCDYDTEGKCIIRTDYPACQDNELCIDGSCKEVFGCMVISEPNKQVTLTQDKQCVILTADNVDLDCNHYNISNGFASPGIFISGNNNKVHNCNIDSASYGIYVNYGSGNQLFNNFLNQFAYHGIYLYHSNNNIVSENTLYDAISSYESSNNEIIKNKIQKGYMSIWYGSGNIIRENIGYDSRSDLTLYYTSNSIIESNIFNGLSIDASYTNPENLNQKISTSNLFRNKTIYYNYSISDYEFSPKNSPNAGMIGCGLCNNVTVKDFVIKGASLGIFLISTSNSRIENVTLTDGTNGLLLQNCKGINVSNNNISWNSGIGMELYFVSNNTLKSNVISNNKNNLWIWGSMYNGLDNFIYSSNLINGKNIYYNYSISDYEFNSKNTPNAGMIGCGLCNNITIRDIFINEVNSTAIYLMGTTNSLIENVTLSKAYDGIVLEWSDGNRIINNKVDFSSGASFPQGGILIYGSSHNLLVNNSINNGADNGLNLEYKSSYNNITKNRINGNKGYGLDSHRVIGNNIYENYFHMNTGGLNIYRGFQNNIFKNNLTQNYMGITVSGSSNNTLFNNFINKNTFDGIDIRSVANPYPTESLDNKIANNIVCGNNWDIKCEVNQLLFSENTCDGSCGDDSCNYPCPVSLLSSSAQEECFDDPICEQPGKYCDESKGLLYFCLYDKEGCLKALESGECQRKELDPYTGSYNYYNAIPKINNEEILHELKTEGIFSKRNNWIEGLIGLFKSLFRL